MNFTVRTAAQLAPILHGFRRKKGLTQLQLAKRLGFTQQTLSELERTPQNASMSRLLQLLAALDVELVLQERTHKKPASEW